MNFVFFMRVVKLLLYVFGKGGGVVSAQNHHP